MLQEIENAFEGNVHESVEHASNKDSMIVLETSFGVKIPVLVMVSVRVLHEVGSRLLNDFVFDCRTGFCQEPYVVFDILVLDLDLVRGIYLCLRLVHRSETDLCRPLAWQQIDGIGALNSKNH